MKIRPGASPCRGTRPAQEPDGTTTPPRHYCSAEHAHMVQTYRDARQAWEDERETIALDYASERADFAATRRAPVLADFMSAGAAT